jgi:hypothetical protein
VSRTKVDFISIFGQIEEAASEVMIKDGKANRIPFEQIPESAAYNDRGDRAKFAIVIDKQFVPVFEQLILKLYA